MNRHTQTLQTLIKLRHEHHIENSSSYGACLVGQQETIDNTENVIQAVD